MVCLLYWYSETHYGLGVDDGSSIILFGWRFTPSLLAVAYVQLTAMLLDDVKRTEPFARLARPGGGAASFTILQTSGAWWNALADGFSTRKNGGHRSWLLICAALLDVLGFLTVSPLSSSLLVSRDVAVPKRTEFARMIPNESPITLGTSRDSYLRTIGHILQDVPTSAWITDNYTVLPSWPSDLGDAPIGPLLSTTSQTWETETLVLTTELDCQEMKLTRADYYNDSFPLYGRRQRGMKASIMLESEKGCTFGLALDPAMDIANSGGGSWSDLSTFVSPSWTTSGDGGAILWNNSSPSKLRLNHSGECGGRELLFISNPWFDTPPTSAEPPSAYSTSLVFSKDFEVSGQLCAAKYFMANTTVTASISEATAAVTFNTKAYQENKVAVPDSLFNTSSLQGLMLDANWTDYIQCPAGQSRPFFGGLSAILASLHDFNVTTLLGDEELLAKAARIKQRFLGEVLQSSLSSRRASRLDTTWGLVTVIERRVAVTPGIAISLVVILFVSVCLSLLVWTLSRPQRRPLNLKEDPATTTGLTSLVAFETTTRLGLQNLDRSSKKGMCERLQGKTYHTTPSILHEMNYHEDNTSSKYQFPQRLTLY